MAEPAGEDPVAWAGPTSDRLMGRVVRFAQLVRADGVPVTSGRIIDAQRSLCHIDLGRRDDVYHALRANLIGRPEDIPRFDARFTSFWLEGQEAAPESEDDRSEGTARSEQADGGDARPVRTAGGARPAGEDTERDGTSYSALEVLRAKDFGELDAAELRQLQELMAHLPPKLLTVRSRRFRPGPAGSRLDFRRTMRQSLRTGGDAIDLAWRRRRLDTGRLVLVCDVSRSMERYSRFLIQFMYAFQNELPRTETFVFSTRLTRLTSALRGGELDEALARATQAATGWSSGTRIGECLSALEGTGGPAVLDRRTVVVILSDGWDQGDPARLGEAMRAIKRRSRRVIWLNPLLADRRYRPLVVGMRAALPHIDLLLPCHNLASLQAVATALRTV